ncbi:SDR family NAD(P)-dependent oxidoreductase [Prolixibacteraceae bacterium JC049]|nr:SDR family NAD(P)-dependent oxidoreductase [Prolixibacteraceae bacterium JC049]
MIMSKVALITGSTNGIGKETAIGLAKRGYSIHVLGTNKMKGKNVLDELKSIFPEGKHELFLIDLSSVEQVNTFLDNYIKKYAKLDVLVLNAGIYPRQQTVSEDGIDLAFSIGYISRYLFSVRLNELLEKSDIGKVVHVNGSPMGRINYSKLKTPTYSKLKSVWQNAVGSALLVQFWKKLSKTNVDHMQWNPGIVNTDTVQKQGRIVRFLSSLMGMIEASEAGEMLAKHIEESQKRIVAGQFFFKGKAIKAKSSIKNGVQDWEELVQFSEEFTGVAMRRN